MDPVFTTESTAATQTNAGDSCPSHPSNLNIDTTTNDTHQQHQRFPSPIPSLHLCSAGSFQQSQRMDDTTTTGGSASHQQRQRPYMYSSNRNSTDCPQKRTVLVTGGAGYIGSHTVLELLNADYSIVVMDNLVNSNLEALTRVEYLTGKSISFVEGDVTNEQDLDKVFQRFSFFSVIHLAAIKAVGESTQIPLEYYHNNVTGSLNLLRVMERYKVKNLVFSSSATVYGGGEPDRMPVNETASLGPVTNPYGRTKLFVEEILQDLCASDPEWNVCLLRFFNPVGAHPSGLIGECPQGVPNNLLPYVIRVLQGHLPCVQIFGSDYDTTDGTGVRDYIHVCDLATGHVAALKKLEMEQAQKKKDQSLRASTPSSPIPPPAATVPVSPSSPLPTPKPSYSSSSVSSVSSTSLSGSESDSALSSSSSSSSTSSSIASPISPSFSDTLTPSSSSKAQHQRGQCMAYNLGTGAGYSVLEIINAMEKATQKTIPYKIVERRLGDVGVCTADATLANEELGWKPLYTMDDMCQDMWRWTRRNPNGYAGPLVDND